MATTALHRRTAHEIIALARRENRAAGSRLSDAALARQLGISRTPVRAALLHLKQLGAVSHEPGDADWAAREAAAQRALAAEGVSPVVQPPPEENK